MEKDMTPAQVTRWVLQEAAKHPTRASRDKRLASERRTVEMSKAMGLDRKLPNSAMAHARLIRVLEDANAQD